MKTRTETTMMSLTEELLNYLATVRPAATAALRRIGVKTCFTSIVYNEKDEKLRSLYTFDGVLASESPEFDKQFLAPWASILIKHGQITSELGGAINRFVVSSSSEDMIGVTAKFAEEWWLNHAFDLTRLVRVRVDAWSAMLAAIDKQFPPRLQSITTNVVTFIADTQDFAPVIAQLLQELREKITSLYANNAGSVLLSPGPTVIIMRNSREAKENAYDMFVNCDVLALPLKRE